MSGPLACNLQTSGLDTQKYDARVTFADSSGITEARRALLADPTLTAVLDAVRRGDARSRLDISQRTGLSRTVVAQRVAELLDRGLVTESGIGPSTGGRPPRQLRFDAESGHLLVADLGATSIAVAITDLNGAVLHFDEESADIAEGPGPIIGRVEALFDALEARGEWPGPLRGVGVGVPGPVEFATGRPVAPPIMPGWDGYPIRERLAARYDAPVWVDNDVNVMALGEWQYGAAFGHDNVVFLKIGTGIGAGLISDGLLHRGAQGAAGDVGHIGVIGHGGVLCRCGNVGCLEAVAGGGALARDGEAAAREGRSAVLAEVLDRDGEITARDVAAAAARGDAVSVELLQRAGRYIGYALASIVNFFNPSLIVVGGGVAGSGDVLIAAIREVVYGRSLPLATRELAIRRSSLGLRAGVMGAAAMVLDGLFSPDGIAAWERHPDEGRRTAVVGA